MENLLAQLVAEVEGALGAAVGGGDGLLIDQYTARGNLSAMVAEQANILRSTRLAYTQTLENGELREIMIVSDNVVTYTRPINNEFFLVLLLDPRSNVGKARLRSLEIGHQLRELIGI